jgi:hypothetical protein
VADPVPLPPPIIRWDDLRVERRVEPDGQIVSFYFDKRTEQKVPLQETFHLVRDPASFDPPPA